MTDKATFNKRIKDVSWPDGGHPMTGEPFITCIEIEQETIMQEHRWGPPFPPLRTYDIYNDDDEIIDRYTMTDKEWKKAQRMHKKERAEYDKTMGRATEIVGYNTAGTFACESGVQAKGQWDGKQWHWDEYSVGVALENTV